MPTSALHDATAMRHADPALLAQALADARTQLLGLFAAYRAGLATPSLTVPLSPELNPPLWELGHIAWFEEYWIARNPQRGLGNRCDPQVARAAPLRAEADALYNSSTVPHDSRWQLPLPDAATTQGEAARIREGTLERLWRCEGGDDAATYFYRLALFHEDMHREAWIYMAQNLGIALPSATPRPHASDTAAGATLAVKACTLEAGAPAGGFAFDNECERHAVPLDAFEIDAAPVRWAQVIEFVEAGGYTDARWWTAEGWAWLQDSGRRAPRYLQRGDDGRWRRSEFGRTVALDLALPAMNLSHHEALAWCRFAGRRLPTEFEWEAAALHAAADPDARFHWGQVWEWTASPFAPYPGFRAHPYRDYSAPWFDGRPVLRGASFATAPRMKHPRYRNYFTAERNDIFAGFRSCAN